MSVWIRQCLRQSGLAIHASGLGFVDRNIARLERGAKRLIERDAGVAVGDEGGDFGRLRGGEIALLLDDQKRRGSPEGEFLLFGLQQLFLKSAVVDGGLITGASLLKTDRLVRDIDG